MTQGLIDIGANLLSEQFDADRDAVLTRAQIEGLEHIIITASNLATVSRIVDFIEANRYRKDWPILHATAGIHPHEAAEAMPGFETTIADWLRHERVVSSGEAGLDYHRNFSPREAQRRVFAAQIELARTSRMPLFVHDRDSGGETLELLERGAINPAQVVIHCFTGSADELDRYLAAGFLIGITGWVCDRRRGETLRSLVPRIPPERLLIETDAPYLLPHDLPKTRRPSNGRRNEPATLGHIAATLAQLLQMEPSTLIAQTRANALRFFNLSDARSVA